MKKFAANYLINEKGEFLKNGIVVAEDDGTALQYIDTSDNLIEIAGLRFHNGILLADSSFLKSYPQITSFESDSLLSALVLKAVEGLDRFSTQNLIDLGKNIQEHFPELKIPEIMNGMTEILLLKAGFVRGNIPGIFLISGVDLPNLQFAARTRIKRIL